MQIDPKHLFELRRTRGLSRAQLAKKSNVSERQIRRLENPRPENRNGRTHAHTLERLAEALRVEPGVLTGELPLPDSGRAATTPDAMRSPIGALIEPKARLAYDLARRRYGVSITEIINMAPLFFVLLAEGSLVWRREKLDEAGEAIGRLEQIDDEAWRRMFDIDAMIVAQGPDSWESESIRKADIFGEQPFDGSFGIPPGLPESNPFAKYLRKLADTLKPADGAGVVDVKGGDPGFDLGFEWSMRFPDYDVCRDELDRITNGSSKARAALESGFVRLSKIPEELMAEDAGEERAKWLGDQVPDMVFNENEMLDLINEIPDLVKKGIEEEAAWHRERRHRTHSRMCNTDRRRDVDFAESRRQPPDRIPKAGDPDTGTLGKSQDRSS